MELAAAPARPAHICCHFRAEEKGQKCFWLRFLFRASQLEPSALFEDTCVSATESRT